MKNRIHQMNGVIEANLINISSKIELLRNIADKTKEETLKDFLFQSANDLENQYLQLKEN